MSGDKNGQSKEDLGRPSGSGGAGSGLQDVNKNSNTKAAEKYADENEGPAANATTAHPNRNTDKGRDDQGEDTSSE